MNQSEVDENMLENLKGILEDRFPLLLTTYISDSQGRCKRLRDAISSNDFGQIRHEAHGLKGSSRNIGANDFADICAIVEAQATHEDNSDMQQNFAALECKLTAVLRELAHYLH